ncbi:MAG: hypothetical protein E2O88_02805 [Bacteroidetes bacterium]|nr:MAG: hypothetical protein E2O88_02805 [Bacteroidota bacterium]
MTFFKSILLIFFVAIILGACNKNTSTSLTPTAIDSLKTVFQDINTQLEAAWNTMIQDDDDKLSNLTRLLQEVEYSGDYNRLKLDSLKKDIDQLAAVRYDQQTMSDSDLINLYDSMTTQAMGEVTVFTTRLSQFDQYPLMGQLIQEVFEADDRILRFRIDYDRAAKQYNSFIEEHEPDLPLVAKQKVLQSKPLFELQN